MWDSSAFLGAREHLDVPRPPKLTYSALPYKTQALVPCERSCSVAAAGGGRCVQCLAWVPVCAARALVGSCNERPVHARRRGSRCGAATAMSPLACALAEPRKRNLCLSVAAVGGELVVAQVGARVGSAVCWCRGVVASPGRRSQVHATVLTPSPLHLCLSCDSPHPQARASACDEG